MGLPDSWGTEEELLEKLTTEYEIDDETAMKDISAFVSSLIDKNLIQE